MGELLVGEYLLKRVKELGVESMFGVPGGEPTEPLLDPAVTRG